jgi:hypothetical protein
MQDGKSPTAKQADQKFALTFQAIILLDGLRRENHCEGVCAYEEDCFCWRELKEELATGVASDTTETADYSTYNKEVLGWRPIETAPKDGTLLLLWAPSMVEPHLGRWEREWRNNHYGDREAYWYFANVTHWMHIPEPPQ